MARGRSDVWRYTSMGIQEHYSKVRLRDKVNVEMNRGCIVQCNTHITMAHCVEWHRVWNSKTQKQCDMSHYSTTQHETRSDKAEQHRIEQDRTDKNKVRQIRSMQGRARGNGSEQPSFLSTLIHTCARWYIHSHRYCRVLEREWSSAWRHDIHSNQISNTLSKKPTLLVHSSVPLFSKCSLLTT